MTRNEIYKLKVVAEISLDDDEAKEAASKLREINPTYHYCPDWDFMFICSTDPEYDACTCIKSASDLQVSKDH